MLRRGGLEMFGWLKSDRVQALFLLSSWVVICMGIFMIFVLTPWFRQIETLPNGKMLLHVVGGVVGVLGAPASLIILFGMAAFCVFEDGSRIRRKVFWLVLFFATACFGAAIYFFGVYRRQVERGTMMPPPAV